MRLTVKPLASVTVANEENRILVPGVHPMTKADPKMETILDTEPGHCLQLQAVATICKVLLTCSTKLHSTMNAADSSCWLERIG